MKLLGRHDTVFCLNDACSEECVWHNGMDNRKEKYAGTLIAARGGPSTMQKQLGRRPASHSSSYEANNGQSIELNWRYFTRSMSSLGVRLTSQWSARWTLRPRWRLGDLDHRYWRQMKATCHHDQGDGCAPPALESTVHHDQDGDCAC